MAKKAIKRRRWVKKDIAELRKLAQRKTPTRLIAKTLGRTVGALRQKCYSEGIVLGSRKRSRKTRRKK